MKKALLYFFSFFLSSLAYGQCDELFISEYIEGDNHNKALEIYNPTETDIDLSVYRIVRWRNGSNVWDDQQTIELEGTVPALGVYLAVKEPGTQQDGSPEVVDSVLLARADGLYCQEYAVSNAFYFNGDDALTLDKNTGTTDQPFWVVVDLFATTVGDPGEGWGDIPPYATDTFYQAWTQNHTMIRKQAVTSGLTTWVDENGVTQTVTYNNGYGLLLNVPPEFNPAIEWDTTGLNNFDDYGMHLSACDPADGIRDQFSQIGFQLFPNPLQGKQLTIESKKEIEAISLINLLGQEADSRIFNGQQLINYTVPNNITPGVYFVKVRFKDNQIAIKKLVIE